MHSETYNLKVYCQLLFGTFWTETSQTPNRQFSGGDKHFQSVSFFTSGDKYFQSVNLFTSGHKYFQTLNFSTSRDKYFQSPQHVNFNFH